MTTIEDAVADTLDAAADYIAEHGWHQGQSFKFAPTRSKPHPPACIFGAIIASGTFTVLPARDAIESLVGLIPLWNDAPGREQWEVDELLRSTAKRVRHGDLLVPT